jgi:hypothetical protein
MFLEAPMGWTQQIDYVNVETTLPPPVKKQVWDGEKFVPVLLYKHRDAPNREQESWLEKTYGPSGVYKNGNYWDYSVGGNFTVMDEKVYIWYQMKWGNK